MWEMGRYEPERAVARARNFAVFEATAAKAYDQLDFSRGIEVFLNGIPGASMVAIQTASRIVGGVDGTVGRA